MNIRKAASVVVLSVMTLGVWVGPALADNDRHHGRGNGWHDNGRHDHDRRGWDRRPGYYYAPPPRVVYAPPPRIVYAPPPVYYAAPPVMYDPSPSINLIFPLR